MPETCRHLDTVARGRGNPDHPVIPSFEPAEDWWCYPDALFFGVEGAAPTPSHR